MSKFLSAVKVRHIPTGREMIFVKYVYESELKGIPTPDINAKPTKYAKVMWVEDGNPYTATFHESELEEI